MADGVCVQQVPWYRSWRVLGMVVVSLATQGVLMMALIYLLLPLLLPWIWFLIAPFRSFTFTDPPDFIFVGLIALTLAALVARHQKKPYPPGWVKGASVATTVLAVVTPLVPMLFLYLLSRRGQELIGHWPVEMKNDPKHIGLHDSVYQWLSSAVVYASAFAGWGLIAWGALMVHLWSSLPWRKLLLLAAVFVIAWWTFLLEPTHRFEWWLD